MARAKNVIPSTRVAPSITIGAYAELERLASIGVLGSNPTDVAKYLITRGLDDVLRNGGGTPPKSDDQTE